MGATVRDIIECGPVDEVLTVVDRMQNFLPEYAWNQTDTTAIALAKKLVALEDEVARVRARFREECGRILDKVSSNWSAKEIQAATGYDHE